MEQCPDALEETITSRPSKVSLRSVQYALQKLESHLEHRPILALGLRLPLIRQRPATQTVHDASPRHMHLENVEQRFKGEFPLMDAPGGIEQNAFKKLQALDARHRGAAEHRTENLIP